MRKLAYKGDLTRSLRYLHHQLDLIDAAIAALTRYRDTRRQQMIHPSRLQPIPIGSSVPVTQPRS